MILHGTLKTNKPGLLISNHASWIDISILSSLTNICFIAKSEVSGWPIVGFLARLQDTVFIERKINRVIKQKKETLIYNKTGLLIDAYFSATKIKWIIDNVPKARDLIKKKRFR